MTDFSVLNIFGINTRFRKDVILIQIV